MRVAPLLVVLATAATLFGAARCQPGHFDQLSGMLDQSMVSLSERPIATTLADGSERTGKLATAISAPLPGCFALVMLCLVLARWNLWPVLIVFALLIGFQGMGERQPDAAWLLRAGSVGLVVVTFGPRLLQAIVASVVAELMIAAELQRFRLCMESNCVDRLASGDAGVDALLLLALMASFALAVLVAVEALKLAYAQQRLDWLQWTRPSPEEIWRLSPCVATALGDGGILGRLGWRT